jgi:hypothetical protein
MDPRSDEKELRKSGKIVEKLVISTMRPKVKNSQGRPENEQINTAVMKVLQGYDWALVQAPIK